MRGGVFGIALAVGLGASSSAFPSNLPPGFVEELVASELVGPMSMAWGPGGDLWIGGAQGHVYLLRLGASPGSPPRSREPILVAQLPASNQGERGVIGIAVDPDYARNHHIWAFYSKSDRPFRNRLSRFRHVGDQLTEETIILETPDLLNDFHNGGCLRFASDKTLYISTGDDGQFSDTAQDPHDLRGKILHINRDGSPAAGNPFLNGREGDPACGHWGSGIPGVSTSSRAVRLCSLRMSVAGTMKRSTSASPGQTMAGRSPRDRNPQAYPASRIPSIPIHTRRSSGTASLVAIMPRPATFRQHTRKLFLRRRRHAGALPHGPR